MSFNKEDREALLAVLKSFKLYTQLVKNQFAVQSQLFKGPLLPSHSRLEKARTQAVECNQRFLDLVSGNVEASQQELESIPVDHMLFSKCKSTLRQIYRQWSSEGEAQRNQSYGPIIQAVQKYLLTKAKVLVPGCGLGRLVFELAKLGHSVQGNQYTYFMLLVSQTIINQASQKQFTVHPFVTLDQTQSKLQAASYSLSFPDQAPSQCNQALDMSIAAGQFLGSYRQTNEWDAVCTCFFMDTAHNLLKYQATIRTIIKPGGFWINNGPLLYHYSLSNEESVELAWDEFRRVIDREWLVLEWKKQSSYYCGWQGLLSRSLFQCVFFVAVKK